MRAASARTGFVGRLLRVALCYSFFVQAFVAGLSTTVALGGEAAFSISICHDSGGKGPPKDGSGPSSSCPLCAVAANAVVLAAPGPAGGDRPVFLGYRVEQYEPVGLGRAWQARAGTARAPPGFV